MRSLNCSLIPIRRVDASAGFTLVELIMVIVLLGILAAVGSNMLSDGFKTTGMVNASNASEAEARNAMDRLTREIRQVKYSAGYSISTASSSVLQFVNGGNSSVRIALVGTDLKLDYGNVSANTLVSGVSSFTLTYYDANDNVLTDLTTIQTSCAYVQMALSVNDAMMSSPFVQTTRVALRSH